MWVVKFTQVLLVRIYAMSESRYKSKFHYSDFATKTATLPPFRHVEMF